MLGNHKRRSLEKCLSAVPLLFTVAGTIFTVDFRWQSDECFTKTADSESPKQDKQVQINRRGQNMNKTGNDSKSLRKTRWSTCTVENESGHLKLVNKTTTSIYGRRKAQLVSSTESFSHSHKLDVNLTGCDANVACLFCSETSLTWNNFHTKSCARFTRVLSDTLRSWGDMEMFQKLVITRCSEL